MAGQELGHYQSPLRPDHCRQMGHHPLRQGQVSYREEFPRCLEQRGRWWHQILWPRRALGWADAAVPGLLPEAAVAAVADGSPVVGGGAVVAGGAVGAGGSVASGSAVAGESVADGYTMTGGSVAGGSVVDGHDGRWIGGRWIGGRWIGGRWIGGWWIGGRWIGRRWVHGGRCIRGG